MPLSKNGDNYLAAAGGLKQEEGMAQHSSKQKENQFFRSLAIGLIAGFTLIALTLGPGLIEMLSPAKPEPTPFVETDEMRYEKALALLDAGSFDEALAAFEALGSYEDSEERCFETKLLRADALCEAGRGFEAATEVYQLYLDTGDPRAWDRCFALWERVTQRETVSAGVNYTVGVCNDGSVLATGRNKVGQCMVHDWENVAAVSAGGWHPLGLRFDGTVVATGSNYYGQLNVDEWTDIVAVSSGSSHSIGLRADGTALATGYNRFGQCELSGWSNLVAVAAGNTHSVGLRADGTVVAVGENENGQCDVDGWTNVIAISASELNTVALRADGTVLAAGDNNYNQCKVSEWTDIVAVSTYANAVDEHTVFFAHTLGLRADGTVVATGSNRYGQSLVTGWDHMISVSAGGYHSAGLRDDGSAVATEVTDIRGNGGQCNVEDWTDLRIPAARQFVPQG